MLRSVGDYWVNILKKYGVIIPAIMVLIMFMVMIAVDLTDAVSILMQTSLDGFIILACAVAVVFGVGVYYVFSKLKEEQISHYDLVLLVATALSACMLVLFIFTMSSNLLSICKCAFTVIMFVTCIILTVLRANYAKYW
jgi:hypothetical protein